LALWGVRLSGETLACGRQDGEPMPPRSLTHEFAKVEGCVKDVPRVRFHDLQHRHATRLLSAVMHPKVAQERLGHSTVTTALGRDDAGGGGGQTRHGFPVCYKRRCRHQMTCLGSKLGSISGSVTAMSLM